jgi:hypothetical protein
MLDVLLGKRDNWFRPSDVCVAPDGSLFVSDWYDPGVGGHNQQEVDKGRIFRVAPPGSKYQPPKYDFATTDGAAAALNSPNLSVRYMAWTALQAKGKEALPALAKLAKETDNPRVKARALWAAGKVAGNGPAVVAEALKDANPDIRIVGIRLARQLMLDIATLKPLTNDPAPEVRRELCIAIRHKQGDDAKAMWTELALKHDGKDRWYLEALGIAADKQWDAYLDSYLAKVGDSWNTPAGRDIVWRSRAKKSPALLAKIVLDPSTGDKDLPRYMRAFDFLAGPEKEAALKSLTQ